jgi:hypothetical protein
MVLIEGSMEFKDKIIGSTPNCIVSDLSNRHADLVKICSILNEKALPFVDFEVLGVLAASQQHAAFALMHVGL